MRRYVNILSFWVLVASALVASPAHAAGGGTLGCLNWQGNSTIEITSSSATCDSSLVIPSMIDIGGGDLRRVRSIGESAFEGNESFTSVTLPDTLFSIGSWAFRENTRLTAVTIGSQLTSIGLGAFDGDTALKDFSLDAANPNFHMNNHAIVETSTHALVAFPQGRTGAYTLPDEVLSISNIAFRHAESLTSIVIPNTLQEIGESSFAFATGLKSVIIGSGVTNIGAYAFYGNTSLTAITFLGDLPTIDLVVAITQTFPNMITLYYTAEHAASWTPAFESGGVFEGYPHAVISPVRYAPISTNSATKAHVTGVAKVSRTIAAAPGTWTGTPLPTFRYQWYTCKSAVTTARATLVSAKKCTAVARATKSSLRLASAYKGKFLLVKITGSNGAGSQTVYSKSTVKIS